uniref:Protein kinase domain-containing protein n=1 Tax=Ascaris lumbricoides TaxID=6252 RepID=A0A0M3HGK4_ASCLU
MRKFQHPNIVRIVGIVVDEHPLLILMELCPGGSVLSYLRKNRGRIDKAVKLRFCIEGAAGLAYLESSKCIHRDIAARNVLLTQTYEVKVSDFGMSDERTVIQDEKLDKVTDLRINNAYFFVFIAL